MERPIETDGLSVDEAFSLLGNETRIEIMRTLWGIEGGDLPTGSDGVLSFSELRRRVGIDNTGQFSYHLSQLVPEFVRETDAGYRLSRAGKRIARSIVAMSGEEPEGFPAELDASCPFCGTTLRASYEDQQLQVSCRSCRGKFGTQAPDGNLATAGFPASIMLPSVIDSGVDDGTLAVMDSPAAGLDNDDPDAAFERGLYRCHLQITHMMHGICPACAGSTAARAVVCENHDPDAEICPECHSPFEAWGETECSACGLAKRLPVELFAMGLAPVIGFLHEHGINPLEPSFEDVSAALHSMFDVSVSDRSRRIHVSLAAGDASLELTFSDALDVIDIEK